jgi:hypothetical protein
MSDPVCQLKRELLAAAERQQGQAVSVRKRRGPWLLRFDVQQNRRRRRLVALIAALVVILVAASAFATLQQLFKEFDPLNELNSQGRVTRTVDGVRFSFRVPENKGDARWMNGPIEPAGDKPKPGTFGSRHFLISRSTVGGQAAEAVIFWTAFPDGGQAAACTRVLGSVGPSTADLAAAIAHAPGTKVVNGPEHVNLGGRPAYHVALRVSRRSYCPGYFFTWRDQHWGTFWPGTQAGDAISMWIVDVRGKRIVIEAETKQPGSRRPPAGLNTRPTRADVFKVEAEIEKIVGSIRFRL